MRPALRRLFLSALRSDSEAQPHDGDWETRCLHCRRRLAVRADGEEARQRRFGGGLACSLGCGFACACNLDCSFGERLAACGPFATRIPRAFIHASKSSALICRPFWVIWNRLDLPTATGAAFGGAIPPVKGWRLAQPERAITANNAAGRNMRIE